MDSRRTKYSLEATVMGARSLDTAGADNSSNGCTIM